MLDKITNDYKQAMKDKEALKASTLSMLRAQIKNVMIDKRVESLDDADIVSIIKKQVKQRQDSIEQFQKGGRNDLAEKENQECEILKGYLPQEMSMEQLQPLVDEAIKEVQASGMKDMGVVMKIVVPKVAGKADNKMVSDLVRKSLSQV